MPLIRWGLVASLALIPGFARAFTLETVITENCHERITLEAIARGGWPGGALPPAPSREEKVIADNLPFQVPSAIDPWAMAMLVGVRDNDLSGYSIGDLPELAAVQNGPDQSSHCLRAADDDFDQGDEAAIAACRRFIHDEVMLASGASDAPSLDAREEVMIAFRYQRQSVPLSRYAFHMGRALHALQDSYSHSFRASETLDVVGVLNYVDALLPGTFDLRRDGHPHLGTFDHCTGSTIALRRAELASAASASLLSAAAGARDSADRTARVDAVLDGALHYAAGCDSENDWCGELGVRPDSGCSTTGGGVMLPLIALAFALRRRCVRF